MIAVMLMAVLYGKSVVSVACKALACESISAETGELTEDSEGKAGKDAPIKSCKKLWADMESGEELLPTHPFIGYLLNNLPSAVCAGPQKHFQKIFTPPPLI